MYIGVFDVVLQAKAYFDVCLSFFGPARISMFDILQTAHISMFDCHSSDQLVFRFNFVILQTSVYWCV